MTQTLASPPRETAHAARVQQVDHHMADLVARLKGPEFELVHPARWRHLDTGHHVETGYSYGEGRVRVFLGGGRTADHLFVLSGREDDMDAFNALFPVSSE
ncbi:hypothetical protein HOU95_gp033 [Streptomyces phage Hiyaa]|uniref:Uncharacterized protein n=1 Tax=Streptomyces phage Hiyaa TaxID=2499072 RepID=A0A3S9U8U9_9CAUD|nr:hypothetical protein HOU95_gp033 [Streptomyces phage Hiyaa]AZS06673.1 hypothetical protein SEA_HIYAA_33 [Streptomyces phage Hiyaa]